MTVWIVFGDIRCSDGDNIFGVYASKSAALARIEFLERYNKDTFYSTEPFEVED
jgi:hypothetical protein